MALWSLKGKKVLIIDDFAEMRSSLRNMLLSYGADEITTAATGEDAVLHLCQHNFDIILCDYNLGDGKDGQQVLEEAKHRNRLPYSTVFIMVTAENTLMMVMGALEYQPDEYLSKPFTQSVLQRRLQRQLDKKETLKPLSRALKQKNTPKAIALCEQLISESSRSRNDLLKLKCELLIEEQEHEQALTICQEILNTHPILWPLHLIGTIYMLQDEYTQAQNIFENIIKENANFIAAYDSLSQCQRKLENHSGAQKTLMAAVEKSPKSVNRQRSLAETAEYNGDFITAEQARRRVIRFGRNSILHQATDYHDLAMMQIQNNNTKESLRTVELLTSEFKDDDQAKLIASLTKTKIYEKADNKKLAMESIQHAIKLFDRDPSGANNQLTMELIQACLDYDLVDEANRVATHLANNNHDNLELLNGICDIYRTAGMGEFANEIIEKVRIEITKINNRGVELLEAGQLDDAIALLEKTMIYAQNNQVINSNIAQAYLMKIKQSGHQEVLYKKARTTIDNIKNNPKFSSRYKALNTAYWKFFNTAHE